MLLSKCYYQNGKSDHVTTMKEATIFSGGENISNSLRISKDLWTFLQSKIVDKELRNSVIKESGTGNFSITLEYSLTKDKFVLGKLQDKGISRERHSSHLHHKTSTTQPKPPVMKRKTPSQRRRDKKRFREFLERKRLNKKSVSKPALPVQCPPPPRATLYHAARTCP